MTAPADSVVRLVNDPTGHAQDILDAIARAASFSFSLAIGSTRTSELDGVSAAGATPADRRLTPTYDAEAFYTGRVISGKGLPVSPEGIVSPVVITRACLSALESSVSGGAGAVASPVSRLVFDCGSFVPPAIEVSTVGSTVAQCLSTGQALPVEVVLSLFARGLKAGSEASRSNELIVIAECVPGGTSTAMAVLAALGFEVSGRLSSSIPQCNHELRLNLVRSGLERSTSSGGFLSEQDSVLSSRVLSENIDSNHFDDDELIAWRSSFASGKSIPFALRCVASVGDPMQAFVAGYCISASAAKPVVLAGGSQMIAVYALVSHLVSKEMLRIAGYSEPGSLERVVVATTRWVAFDSSASVAQLAIETGAPLISCAPDFGMSRHAGLRAYEKGHVKEGVGAGAALLLASHRAGLSASDLVAAIDGCYDEMVPGLSSTERSK